MLLGEGGSEAVENWTVLARTIILFMIKMVVSRASLAKFCPITLKLEIMNQDANLFMK